MVLRLIRKAAILLASGYILFFFSERVFWSFWRPGDTLPEFLITWFAYCLLAWIFLDLVRRFKVASFPPLFLCGAVFGWVDEGVVVDTLYGNSTNPLPLSISFTGLSWHALLSVGVGWYLIGKVLTDEKLTRTESARADELGALCLSYFAQTEPDPISGSAFGTGTEQK